MNLSNPSIPSPKHISFEQPAVYLIWVVGNLDKSCSDRLGGLEIVCCESEGSGDLQVTSLTGLLIDQAALLGVLNTLYNWHYPLLSVQYLENVS